MAENDPKTIVLQFNDCINNRDIEALAGLMTDDHVFIDSANNQLTGKPKCLAAWRDFFNALPDYKNVFTSTSIQDNLVIMTGYSTCSDKRLDGPAIWTAKIVNNKIAEWRVYEDTQEIRKSFNVSKE